MRIILLGVAETLSLEPSPLNANSKKESVVQLQTSVANY